MTGYQSELGVDSSIVPLPVVLYPEPDQQLMRPSKSRRSQLRHLYICQVLAVTNRAIQAINSLHAPYVYQPVTYAFNMKIKNGLSSTFTQLYSNLSYQSMFFTNSTSSITKRQQELQLFIQRQAERHLVSCRQVNQPLTERDGLGDMSKFTEHLISDYCHTTLAKPIVCGKVALPVVGNRAVDVLRLLPERLSIMWAQPSEAVLRTFQQLQELRSSKYYQQPRKPEPLGDRAEYVQLVKRMHSVGMIAYRPVNQVKAVNGMFCVDKDDQTLRCIIDARPANELFVKPEQVELPNPSHIATLYVSTEQPLHVHKMDLSNFYHHLRLPEWLQPYMALPGISLKNLDMGQDDDTLMYPCCTTMPMGWSHAVYLAQQVHEYVLYSSQCVSRADNILNLSQYRIQSDQVVHAIYIDDHIGLSTNRELAQLQYDRVMQAYEQYGLQCKPSKCQPPDDTSKTVLGVQVGGPAQTRHLLQPQANKMYALLAYTLHVLRTGETTGTELSVLVGHWTWLCMLKRSALGVMNGVYHFVTAYQFKRKALPPAVRRELWQLIGIAPLLMTDLSAGFSSTLHATDASLFGNGVVQLKHAADRELNILWMQSRIKWHERRLDCVDELLADLSGRQWTVIVSRPWRYPAHINQLELQSCLTLLRHIVSCADTLESRYITLIDNTVAYYNIRKGRSSRDRLRGVMSKLSALMLASGVILIPIWVESELNPADTASRLQ